MTQPRSITFNYSVSDADLEEFFVAIPDFLQERLSNDFQNKFFFFFLEFGVYCPQFSLQDIAVLRRTLLGGPGEGK